MLGDTTALVTGASQGIGEVIATTLGGYGTSVVRAARSAGAVEETAAAVEAAGGEAVAVGTGVTDEAAVEAFGGLDCRVNNARKSEALPQPLAERSSPMVGESGIRLDSRNRRFLRTPASAARSGRSTASTPTSSAGPRR